MQKPLLLSPPLTPKSLFKLTDSNSANQSKFISNFGLWTFFPLIKLHQTWRQPWSLGFNFALYGLFNLEVLRLSAILLLHILRRKEFNIVWRKPIKKICQRISVNILKNSPITHIWVLKDRGKRAYINIFFWKEYKYIH